MTSYPMKLNNTFSATCDFFPYRELMLTWQMGMGTEGREKEKETEREREGGNILTGFFTYSLNVNGREKVGGKKKPRENKGG